MLALLHSLWPAKCLVRRQLTNPCKRGCTGGRLGKGPQRRLWLLPGTLPSGCGILAATFLPWREQRRSRQQGIQEQGAVPCPATTRNIRRRPKHGLTTVCCRSLNQQHWNWWCLHVAPSQRQAAGAGQARGTGLQAAGERSSYQTAHRRDRALRHYLGRRCPQGSALPHPPPCHQAASTRRTAAVVLFASPFFFGAADGTYSLVGAILRGTSYSLSAPPRVG